MSNLRDIKKRIGSVKNTQQITRAMKMVSGAKLRRAEERIRQFRPYVDGLSSTLQALLAREDGLDHALMRPGVTGAPPLFLLITSDRGLCGSFNSSIVRNTMSHAEENAVPLNEAVFYTVGRKAAEQAKRRSWNVLGSTTSLPEPPTPEIVADIAGVVTEAFLDGAVGSVTLVYNRFLNALSQVVTVQPILPLSAGNENQDVKPPFLTEPQPHRVLDILAPQIIEAQIQAALLDSIAGEHGARMTAMDSATTNASEMIQKLTLTYNRARQAAITAELLDIVNGANSIE